MVVVVVVSFVVVAVSFVVVAVVVALTKITKSRPASFRAVLFPGRGRFSSRSDANTFFTR